MKKIIFISLWLSLITSSLLSTTINSVSNWNYYPIPKEITSKSRGGLLADKEAMEDGLGAIVIKSINTNTITVDNSIFNKILFENKDKIDTTNGLKELLINNIITIDNSKLDLINNSGLINPNASNTIIDGTMCDDNNVETINDIYTNNVCMGTNVPNGSVCDDGNAQTIGETYLNGVCQGGLTQSCQNGYSGDYIGDISCPNITEENLEKFSNLTSISGFLNISGYMSGTMKLNNLNGLRNLKSVGQYIQLYNVASLNGLEKLTTIGGSLTIGNGPTSLNGLNNLNYVGASIYIYSSSNLNDLSALNNVTHIGTSYPNGPYYVTMWVAHRNYTVKLSSNSLICKNYWLWTNDIAWDSVRKLPEKNYVCNN